MVAGLEIELPAVPWVNEVFALGVVLQHACLAVFVDRLTDPLIDAALAHRPATMGALIIPGNELAIYIEHANLGAVAGDHPPLALAEFIDTPDHKRLHATRIPLRFHRSTTSDPARIDRLAPRAEIVKCYGCMSHMVRSQPP